METVWYIGVRLVGLVILLGVIAGCAAPDAPGVPPEGPQEDRAVPTEGDVTPTLSSTLSSSETQVPTEAPTPRAPATPEAQLALYLTAEEVTPAHLLPEEGPLDLGAVPLEPEPFLTQDDIVGYEAATHALELTPAAAARVAALPVLVRGRAFVVTVGEERIYAGAFWTPLSSLSYDGVVILLLPNTPPAGNVYRIELGYPGPGFFRGADPRGDPRILHALAEGQILRY